jgi:hypothetical protein
MTRLTLLLALAMAVMCAFAAEKAEQKSKSKCTAEISKVAELTKQVEELQEKLEVVEAKKNGLDGAGGAAIELSVLGAMSTARSLVGNAVQQALDGTDLDEKAAGHFETVRAASVDAMGKVSAIDLSAHVETIKSHDLYKTHVAPAMHVAAKKYDEHVRPAVDQHLSPVLEKAKNAATQTIDTAVPKLNAHKATVTSGFSQVPAFLASLEAKLGDIIAPLFDMAAKASPSNASMLPSRPLDRFLLLLVLTVLSYYCFFWAMGLTAIALSVVYKSTSLGLKLGVVLPLNIILKILNFALCFMSCFYCCGLCRRKKAAEDATPKKEKKGAEKKEQKKADAPKKATAEEITQLLEASKKKGKLDDAVKLLCAREKELKPMEGKSFPENVRGKMLDKATLKKAFGNFKEIDMRKL